MAGNRIEIKGLDKLLKKMDKYADGIAKYYAQAGNEAANDLLKTEGLRKYPPSTSANEPPPPFYIRGRGMQTIGGNLNNSERLGTKWYVKSDKLQTFVGNPVSYAVWVHGDDQAKAMKDIGWRQLKQVAQEKVGQITEVYNKWVEKALKDFGL